MERRAIRDSVFSILCVDLSRIASDIVFDVAGDVGLPNLVEDWVKENISESEIERMVEEIMKDPKLRRKWEAEYKTCMEIMKDHKYCTEFASTSVARKYFSSEKVTKKLLEWVRRYLKKEVPHSIDLRVEAEKEILSEIRPLTRKG